MGGWFPGCGDERDGLLPTRYVLADVPYVIRHPCPQAEDSPRAGVSRIVKTAQSRGRTGRTLFGHCDSCSPQARPRGRSRLAGTGEMLRTGVILYFDTAGYTGHQAGKR